VARVLTLTAAQLHAWTLADVALFAFGIVAMIGLVFVLGETVEVDERKRGDDAPTEREP
jgi:hypothetical protein